jgi:uncharacterized protein (DUF2236 family)
LTGLFPDDAVIRRVDGESVLLLGGGRALLMQLAHPLVAAGVAEHSDFAADPFRRLQRTVAATWAIVFGSAAEAATSAAAIRAVHDRVVGDGYSANDPALLLWVHATLVDTAVRVYRQFVGPLSDAELADYYEQSTVLATMLGLPRSAQPADVDAFRAYLRTMVASLEVSDTARSLAGSVLAPAAAPWFAGPAFAVFRQVTVGLLPLPLRLQYGFSWDGRRRAALRAAAATSRAVLPLVPAGLRRARRPALPASASA